MDSPTSKCAFETNAFYSELEKMVNSVGGAVEVPVAPTLSSVKSFIPSKPIPNMNKQAVREKNNAFQQTVRENNKWTLSTVPSVPSVPFKRRPIQFKTDDIYYNEVNGIPIIVYKKKGMRKIRRGGLFQRKTKRNKKNTKRGNKKGSRNTKKR